MNMKVPPKFVMKDSNLNGYKNILTHIDQSKTTSIFHHTEGNITEYRNKEGQVILTVKENKQDGNTICEYIGENGNFTQLQDFENDGKLNLMGELDKKTGIYTKTYDSNQDRKFDKTISQ